MTTQITERDKKILMIFGVVLVIAALIYFGIMPLADKGQELSQQVDRQKLEKQEKEMKVSGLPVLQLRQEGIYKDLETSRALYYDIMRNVEIDKMLTNMALEGGANVRSLSITMPDTEKYASLIAYPDQLAKDGGAKEQAVFTGAYMAEVRLTLEGSKGNLQTLLDEMIGTSPKLRVSDFSWQENKLAGSAAYTLSLTVEIYMCQDIEEYIDSQLTTVEDAAE